MTGQRSFLFDYVERFEGYVKTADKTLKPMVGYGKITDGRYIIKDVRYVEGLGYNMFSSSQFYDNGYWVKQFQYGSDVNDEDKNVILSARRNGNLYSTVFRSIPQTHPQFEAFSDPRNAICLLAKASKEDSWLWHRRLCHQNFKDMNKLVSKNLVKGLPETRLSKDTLCPACEQGKMTRSSHPPRMDTNSKSPLDMIHMDLCGPTRTESLARKKYMLVLVDEFSRFTWLEFLRAKSDAADRIIAFIKRIQVLLGRRVKKLRSDNEPNVGISHNFSAVRTPQQNGVVERKNRTLVEAARSMMAHSGVPQSFWAEAVLTACYTQNRTLIVKRTGKTAYEMVERRKPNIDYFRVFGCKCYVLNDPDDLGKFEPKSDESIFIGYSHNSKAYRVFNKRTEPSWKAQMLTFPKPKLILLQVQMPHFLNCSPHHRAQILPLNFLDLADYDLPTLTSPIVVPAHAGSTSTSVTSDAFITEPSSNTSTNSVTPESAVSPTETSSVAPPEPVREQTPHPVLAPIPEEAPLPSPNKLVSWASKKQNCVSLSTAEAEYVVAASCCSQIIWMRTQLRDYGFKFDKIPIYCDSKSTIAISCNPVQHTKTKHIDIRYHFIKDHVEKGTIELYFVNTEFQLADLFTKALDEKRFNFLITKLELTHETHFTGSEVIKLLWTASAGSPTQEVILERNEG
ncbi:LOW QUALITY PROTEIN: hypothetical protein OSB04_031389 [Centaurea solstitialis]|uniref:Integrase catalytic domain-containing protein n=1 Tax=Centaurea solstitialis TaxID=347529 RepID=A0AA38W826_9ASTR|nr:LOW QUALITY PROTEIN: hypothetical protein OSB04_031389 [Centaurea solstitialis]